MMLANFPSQINLFFTVSQNEAKPGFPKVQPLVKAGSAGQNQGAKAPPSFSFPVFPMIHAFKTVEKLTHSTVPVKTQPD